MFFWIMLAILVVSLCISLRREYKNYRAIDPDAIIGTVIVFLSGTAGILLVLAMIGLLATCFNVEADKYSSVTTHNLKSVSAGSNVDGSFFLGSGSVDEEQYFFYAYEQDGWVQLDKVPVSESRVSETVSADEARLVITKTDHYHHWLFPVRLKETHNYDFYVPEDSVVETYEITTENQ